MGMGKIQLFAGLAVIIVVILAFGAFRLGLVIVEPGVAVFSPDWVTLKCDVITPNKQEVTTSFKYKSNEYTIVDCSEFTKECELFYEINPSLEPDFFDICNWEVDLDKCNSQTCGLAPGSFNIRFGTEIFLDIINPGEVYKFTAWDKKGFLCLDRAPLNGLSVIKRFDEYGLKVFGDTPYQERPGTCLLGAEQSRIEAGTVSENPLRFTGGQGVSFVNYINEWNLVYNGPVYEYKGKEVYCTGLGTIWEIDKIIMENGDEIWFTAGTPIFDVDIECCPQQQGCNENFVWDNLPGDCITTAECPGQGFWFTAGNRKAQRYECISNNCDLSNVKNVECSVPGDCANEYCDMSNINPDNWECKGGTPPSSFCGDRVCDKLTENFANCPTDCSGVKEPINVLMWIVIGILALVLIIVLIIVIRKKKTGTVF